MQINIQIPDEQKNRVLDAICTRFGYASTIDDGSGGKIPNPETRAQFTKRMMISTLQDMIKQTEVEEARRAAAEAAHQTPPPDMT